MSPRILLVSLVLVAAAGCQTTDPLQQYEQSAVDTALARAKFDMNCPGATGSVLSSKQIEPISIRFGVARAEYTVGVQGCGKRATMIVMCAEDGSGCVAGDGQ
jgi:hypothetical protein